MAKVGVSGFAFHMPKFRVSLKDWCHWTGYPWNKVKATVGHSFRVPGPSENCYTMAATAVLKLIQNYDIDPERIGFLGLGTESSVDNSAGAVIVKGMVDQALREQGLATISRNCEVPEFKHACLGGVYALKSGLRYLACDGEDCCAIVVSSDIAEYERGSTGEPTQGACAVAQLLERNPGLYEVDLSHSGSASAYRAVDFRKPHRNQSRHLVSGQTLSESLTRDPDYPLFNGPYSTVCYIDEAIQATRHMLSRLGRDFKTLYREVGGSFFHRPYHRMPINVLAALYVFGLSRSEEHLPELRELCREAGTDFEKTFAESVSRPELIDGLNFDRVDSEIYPEAMKTTKYFRGTSKFREVMEAKLGLGLERMKELGNVYTGSLPAWIGAGLEEALEKKLQLAGDTFFTLGYGSGDAAEAMLIRICDGFEVAAAKIAFTRSLDGAIDLNREEYKALHDGFGTPCPDWTPSGEFVIERIGKQKNPGFIDKGIEYYRYVP